MAKPEWGTKRICQHCGAKFYDLHCSPIVCPNCDTEFDPEALLKSRRSRNAAPAKPAVPAAAAAKAKKAELETSFPEADIALAEAETKLTVLPEEDEDDASMIEDAAELGEDKDDVAEVVITGDEED
ncbi:MAG: TIGR02300 family protein [Kiloniellaceae bacterium]